MLKFLTRLVYGGSSTLRDYERACLLKVASALDTHRGESLQKQIEGIELVQRFSDDKLVAFHYLKKKGTLPVLPDKGDEIELARLEIGTGRAKRVAKIVLHEGVLSSLEFSSPPKQLAASAVNDAKVSTRKTAELDAGKIAVPLPDDFMPPVRSRFAIRDVLSPAPEATQVAFLERHGAALPGDYRAMLKLTDGFKVGDWTVLGTRVQTLVLKPQNLTVLAESDPSLVCVVTDSTAGQVLLYDNIDDDVVKQAASFEEIISQVLSDGAR